MSSRDVWEISAHLTLSRIAPGLWVHSSTRTLDDGSTHSGNGLLVLDRGQLVLVDTPWGAELTEDLLSWIQREWDLPLRHALITHFHDDSMGGTAVLEAHGIPSFGSALTRVQGARTGLPLPVALEGLDRIDGSVGIGPVELFYPGPGHSLDNLVAWIPQHQVLFGSCALRSPALPGLGNTADADLSHWAAAMQRVLDRHPNARIVVPGHGAPGDLSLLKHTIALTAKANNSPE